jgi:hypothetical protein
MLTIVSELRCSIELVAAQNPQCQQAFACLEAIYLIQIIQEEITKLKPLASTREVIPSLKLLYKLEQLRSIHDRVNHLIPGPNQASPVILPILKPLFDVHLKQSHLFEERDTHIAKLEQHLATVMTTHPNLEIIIAKTTKVSNRPTPWYQRIWRNKSS